MGRANASEALAPMKENLIVGSGTPLQHWRDSQRLVNLPSVEVTELVPQGSRAVIVAPHPDDEVLGTGGLLQLINTLNRPLLLISVTDGTASHPGSSLWPACDLAYQRALESEEALTRLGLPVTELHWVRGGFADSQVAADEALLTAFIEQHLKPDDVVFSTWCRDGHCDHDAVGRASRQAAANVGACVHELPIWTWHWAHDDDPRVPWERARRLDLSAHAVARKRYAAQAFTSQIHEDPSTGAGPVLGALALERLLQPYEVVFVQG